MAISNAVSISISEPREILENRFLSVLDFLEKPSAIFKCTETAALLICCVKAYFSSGGNDRVLLYKQTVNSLDAEKMSKCVCDNSRNIK